MVVFEGGIRVVTKNRARSLLLYGAASITLAACGGGATIVQTVPFENEVTSADYIGKSFPVFFLVGEAGDPNGRTVVGKGVVTYNSASSITVTLPGGGPVTLNRTGASGGSTTFAASGPDAISALITGFSSTTAFRLATVADDDLAVLGGFGFETLEADRPNAIATYDTAGAVFLTATNVENFLPIAGSGSLTANFGSGDVISGTLLDADPVEVNLAGVDVDLDILDLVFTLENGRITPSGFVGGVAATAELNIDGGPPTALGANMTGDSVEGAFFGGEAAAVAGIFEGDLALSNGAAPVIDFNVGGFFSGSKN